MQPDYNEYVCESTSPFTNIWRTKIALEGYSDEHEDASWEIHWMNLESADHVVEHVPTNTGCNDSQGSSGTI